MMNILLQGNKITSYRYPYIASKNLLHSKSIKQKWTLSDFRIVINTLNKCKNFTQVITLSKYVLIFICQISLTPASVKESITDITFPVSLIFLIENCVQENSLANYKHYDIIVLSFLQLTPEFIGNWKQRNIRGS